ncbi:Deoxycytidylate deaminase [Pseudozyma hubeiensis]|nr:Deoxycytidylate deaminase [Pseudozyma hubeiensis]
MLIALIGPPGAGKATIAQFLAEQHGFRLLRIDSSSPSAPASTASSSDKHSASAIALPNSKVMLDYVTDRWDSPFVTLDLTTVADLDAFIKRPFFLCVEVAAPLLMRWERYTSKHRSVSLEEFVALDDELSYGGHSLSQTNGSVPMLARGSSSSSLIGGNGIIDNMSSISLQPSSTSSSSGLTSLRRFTHLLINNSFPHLSHLHSHLTTLNLPSTERLRPCWDTYFLKLCNLASLRSNCMKRRVGAVLVSSNRILATGYNGTPSGLRNCNQGGCARCNNTLVSEGKSGNACGQNLEECLCLHAEENALLEAGRAKIAMGGEEGKGATMYCNTCPCLRCAVKIIQTGIRKVVYQLEYSMDSRTKMIFQEAGVEIRQFHLDA